MRLPLWHRQCVVRDIALAEAARDLELALIQRVLLWT